MEASRLEPGDYLQTAEGDPILVTDVQEVRTTQLVYNIEVEQDHNFFVSELQILCHNCGEGGLVGVIKDAAGRWRDAKGRFAKAPDTANTLGDWKGPTDYSRIKDPNDVVNNTKPTPRQVRQMKEANRKHNDGVLRDDVTGEVMVDSAKSKRGVSPPQNEAQVDHIKPQSKGGTRSNTNLQLRTRKNNRDKWDKE